MTFSFKAHDLELKINGLNKTIFCLLERTNDALIDPTKNIGDTGSKQMVQSVLKI